MKQDYVIRLTKNEIKTYLYNKTIFVLQNKGRNDIIYLKVNIWNKKAILNLDMDIVMIGELYVTHSFN